MNSNGQNAALRKSAGKPDGYGDANLDDLELDDLELDDLETVLDDSELDDSELDDSEKERTEESDEWIADLTRISDRQIALISSLTPSELNDPSAETVRSILEAASMEAAPTLPQELPTRDVPALAIAEGFDPWCHDLTPLGDALRLKDAYSLNIRYIAQKDTWITFTDTDHRWREDQSGIAVMQGAQRVIEHMATQVQAEKEAQEIVRQKQKRIHEVSAEALLLGGKAQFPTPDLDSPAPAGGRRAYVAKCQTQHRMNEMVSLLKIQPGISVDVSDLDADPLLLGVANGVIDLKTGQLRTNSRSGLITRTAATAFDPDAPAPLWDKFLEKVLPNPEIRAFVQRAMGYTLTGKTKERCLFVPWGESSTGKTTLVEAVRHALQDYAKGLPLSSLLPRQNASIPNDIARLAGARLVCAEEFNEHQRIDEGLVKHLSGGAKLTARFLREEFFDFIPTHKLWVTTNHLPDVQDTSNGIWRRFIVIPFETKIPKDEEDQDLPDSLKLEAQGILAWAVRGCREWQRQGLNLPISLVQARDEYRDQQDPVPRFIRECCEFGPGLSVQARPLYESYTRWADLQCETQLSEKAFGTRLNTLGYKAHRKPSGNCRLGLQLR